ncbi:hypothetical protein CFAM422_006810 [Trichoderma lentiforme]|uniref:Uncharacterized protein n=1 Tax=Trichoderma lentiforme TaxID=1567552 RepID=A0A9P4XE18_9HYPO|nr:hypothetical protein CFAM422_006810 [Trichoderma lentiforme]
MSSSDCTISSIFKGDGSQYLKEANAPIYNILAIPGLGHVHGSGGFWSFKSGSEEVSWLIDLLPTHAICAHVMTFTYPCKRLLEDVSPEDIKSMAIALLDQLEGVLDMV